jgi:hypothetical protein
MVNDGWRAVLRGVAAAAMILALVGCANSPEEGAETVSKTLEEAKAELWAVETELAAYVPDEVVTDRYPHLEKTGVLFDCGEGRYTWPGAMQLRIDPATDTDAILDRVHTDWSSKPDWSVEWVSTESSRYLSLVHADGLQFDLSALRSNTVFDIGSFSSCFELADYQPLNEY